MERPAGLLVQSFVYVNISAEGMIRARREAAARNASARTYGARTGTNHQAGLSGAVADEIGAVCELAVSNYVGIPPNFGQSYDPNSADVGPIEVRGRKMGSAYHDIRVYETDIAKAPFIVGATITEIGATGVVRLNGWSFTAEAYENSVPASFEPHPVKGQARWHSVTALRPMATIFEHLP